jgi:Protein of unknown function (DUF732)
MSDEPLTEAVGYTQAAQPKLAWAEEWPDWCTPTERWAATRRIARKVATHALAALLAAGAIVAFALGGGHPTRAVQMVAPPAAIPTVDASPAVQPMTAGERLLAAMKAHDISVTKPEAAVANAPIICGNLSTGTSWAFEVNAVMDATPRYTQSDADEFLHLVVQFYCPSFDPDSTDHPGQRGPA